jgi:stigma-specific protein Stig1
MTSKAKDREGGMALDGLARDLARGDLSRRQALRGMAAAIAGAWLLSPASALAGLKRRCPPERRCGDDCCRHGERCRKRHGHRKCVCKKGLRRCRGACVNTSRDVNNCGACGVRCDSGGVCIDGVCQPTCGPNQTLCDGNLCVNLQTDSDNCGACGVVCDDAYACVSGDCTLQCNTGETDCNGVCTDTQTDQANCGSCGNACQAGEVCFQGNCTT